jgi:hypothetical protein
MTVPWPRSTLARWQAALDDPATPPQEVRRIARELIAHVESQSRPVRVHVAEHARDIGRYADIARTRVVELIDDTGDVIARMGPR